MTPTQSEKTTAIPPVPRRTLGRTNLSIPVIPIGGGGMGGVYGPVSPDEAMGIIERALELGINHIDTSPCYGYARPKVARAIKALGRDKFIITSRVCAAHGGPAYRAEELESRGPSIGNFGDNYSADRADCSADAALRLVETDLTALGTDYLDAVIIHDPRDIEAVLKPGGTLSGLQRLKEQKVIRNIGLGTGPLEQHLRAMETGAFDMILTFGHFNLRRQTAAERLLPAAAAQNVGVLNGWSIDRGLLTDKKLEDALRDARVPADSPDIAEVKAIRDWCAQKGVSTLALALQFCLRDSRIHGLPLGVKSAAEVEANARAVTASLPAGVWEEFTGAFVTS